jgi:hypothetical protein
VECATSAAKAELKRRSYRSAEALRHPESNDREFSASKSVYLKAITPK